MNKTLNDWVWIQETTQQQIWDKFMSQEKYYVIAAPEKFILISKI